MSDQLCAVPGCPTATDQILCLAHWKQLPADARERLAWVWKYFRQSPARAAVFEKELRVALRALAWIQAKGEPCSHPGK